MFWSKYFFNVYFIGKYVSFREVDSGFQAVVQVIKEIRVFLEKIKIVDFKGT